MRFMADFDCDCARRLRAFLRAGAVGFAFALAPSLVHADAMRCGNKLVVEGDSRIDVRAKCGEPADIQTRTILRRPSFVRHGRRFYYGDDFIEVPVELWTYNFGPNQFMRRLRIVNGEVEEIEVLGYGHYPF